MHSLLEGSATYYKNILRQKAMKLILLRNNKLPIRDLT